MAIKLHDGEAVVISADFHWTSYLGPGAWAVFWGLILIGEIGASPNHSSVGTLVFTAIFGFGPLAYRVTQNFCKVYALTNTRLYVEEGILAKSKKDIPIHKMNDVEMNQGIVQRIFGAGNILVMTGNDKPTKMKHVNCPEDFKNRLTDAIKMKSNQGTAITG